MRGDYKKHRNEKETLTLFNIKLDSSFRSFFFTIFARKVIKFNNKNVDWEEKMPWCSLKKKFCKYFPLPTIAHTVHKLFIFSHVFREHSRAK
ncbi:unnamed protein product [Rhizophagus irregularis]|nr:unnamed protein product [Rhizophagus irregularis]CAB5363502.1 unnamed protein product [Rhizophagus irregularis]